MIYLCIDILTFLVPYLLHISLEREREREVTEVFIVYIIICEFNLSIAAFRMPLKTSLSSKLEQ